MNGNATRLTGIDGRFAPAVLGEEIRERDLGWVRVHEAVHRPNMRLRPHEHEHPALTLVREGGFGLRLRGGEFECDNRGIFFKRGETKHENRFGSRGSRSLVIELQPQHGSPRVEPLPLPERNILVRGGKAMQLAREIEREFRAPDMASGLALEGLVLELLAHALRSADRDPSAHTPEWMPRALDVLHASFPKRPSLRSVAELVGVHPVHLARVFRREQGCTVGEYVRRLRVDHAAERLKESDDGQVEIALEAGFYDQAHFCRCFKRMVGMTPGTYRSHFRKTS